MSMLQQLFEVIKDAFFLSIDYFISPNKRVNYIYLIAALVLSYYVYLTSVKKGSFWKYIFHKKVWLGRSARVDYALFFFNSLVKILLIAPYLYFGFQLAFHTQEFFITRWGYPDQPLSPALTLILYTIALTIIDDLLVYLVHLAMHKIPFLWEFHKIHHSATTMTPITQYRMHPVELIINNIQGIIGFGITTGIFQYLSEGMVSKWLFLGANVFSFVFFMFGANLRHSHVKLRYFNFLEYIFMSPMQHQIHHSRKRSHWDKNMGSKLALWDWLFGTLHTTKNVEKLSFGLGARQEFHYQSFWENLHRPFTNNFKRLINLFQKK